MSDNVTATEAARELILQLVAHSGPLIFMQSGSCCEGSAPMCLPEGELLLGPNDLLIGEIAGCPFYIDQEQYERWNRPQFLIDVLPGASDTFSLEGLEGVHFVTRTDAPCPMPPEVFVVRNPQQ